MKSFKKVLSLVLSVALVATLGGVSTKTAKADDYDITAYLMFADNDWTYQYWYDGADYSPVKATNVTVDGDGEYTVGLDFTETAGVATGMAFAAVGINDAETAYGSATTIDVTSIMLNGMEIVDTLVGTPYTCSDDGAVTRVNLYNPWVTPSTGLTTDDVLSARTVDGTFPDDVTPVPLVLDSTQTIETLYVTFTLRNTGVVKTDDSNDTNNDTNNGDDTSTDTSVAKGTTFTAGNFKYKVTAANKKVAVVGLKASAKKKTALTVPATVKKNGKTLKVTAINSNAFKGASKLKTVTIGKNVTTIQAKAFNGNKKLATVKTKGKLKTVKKNAFKGVKKKLKVTGTSAKANKKLIKKSGAKVK